MYTFFPKCSQIVSNEIISEMKRGVALFLPNDRTDIVGFLKLQNTKEPNFILSIVKEEILESHIINIDALDHCTLEEQGLVVRARDLKDKNRELKILMQDSKDDILFDLTLYLREYNRDTHYEKYIRDLFKLKLVAISRFENEYIGPKSVRSSLHDVLEEDIPEIDDIPVLEDIPFFGYDSNDVTFPDEPTLLWTVDSNFINALGLGIYFSSDNKSKITYRDNKFSIFISDELIDDCYFKRIEYDLDAYKMKNDHISIIGNGLNKPEVKIKIIIYGESSVDSWAMIKLILNKVDTNTTHSTSIISNLVKE
jgi:hypothetical protein